MFYNNSAPDITSGVVIGAFSFYFAAFYDSFPKQELTPS